MCLHGDLFSITFSLICNMTTFSKNCFDLLNPPQGVEDVCKGRIRACMVLYDPFPLI